ESGASAPAAEGALRFTGRVTAVTHAGQPVLSTPLGTLTLEIQAPLPIGSRLTLALPAEALPQPAGASPAPAALGTLAHTWPALDETLQTLREIGAPGAGAAATEMVPRPGPKLASGLLFFLSALGGDVSRWLGNQATQALKNAGRDSLLTRLGQDFGQLSRLADSPSGDWRLFFIPLLGGDQVQQLRLFLRHGQQGSGGGGGGEEDDEPTRFVVELELSRLGDLQLDGLVRDKRFDLILRTRAPLPEFMRRDIAQIFQDANGATGYAGNIGFQSSTAWRFMPIEVPADVASPGVVV
ncbi:MAG: hypothetical protein IIC53_04485, partial [Proteobacteria bacterium]|nr:hypothetical protein [Pseudomonadota bacterium]